MRLLRVRDEADVLPWNLDWYASRGVVTIALDDGSTDGSDEILRRAHREGSIAVWSRTESDDFRRTTLLDEALALAEPQAGDVILVADADEFCETEDGTPLADALREDLDAYDAARFATMEFQMTRADDRAEPDPVRRMRHYARKHKTPVRAFRYVEGLSLGGGHGHRPVLPEDRAPSVSPRAYVNRHYPLRSEAQARRKLARMRPTPESPDRSTHYVARIVTGCSLTHDPRKLARYDEDHRWDHDERLARWELKQRAVALTSLFVQHEQLKRDHAELQARYADLVKRLDERS